jgi:cytochrome c oxidase subunit 2
MQGVLLAVVLVLIAIGAVIFTFVSPWWFTPQASNWGEIDDTMILTIVITGIAFVVINLFIAYTVIRYRRREGSRATFISEHPRLEWALIGLTSLGVVVLLAPGLFVYSRFIAAPQEALEIEVVGEQWRWSYRFPGGDGQLGQADPKRISAQNPYGIDPADPASQDDVLVLGNEVHLPVGIPVKLQLRSKDVLHGFYVPQFRIKMDLVPGMVTHLWFTPTKTGRFEIACAEFCGIGHYTMRGVVVIEEMEAFRAWLASQPTFAQMRGQE